MCCDVPCSVSLTQKALSTGLGLLWLSVQFVYSVSCAAKSCLGPCWSLACPCSTDTFSICLAGASQHFSPTLLNWVRLSLPSPC